MKDEGKKKIRKEGVWMSQRHKLSRAVALRWSRKVWALADDRHRTSFLKGAFCSRER